MAARSNTTGYLGRSADLPVDSTGWTTTQWFYEDSQDPTNFRQLFTVERVADSYFAGIGIPSGTNDLIWELQDAGGYASTTLLTLTLDVWYFVAIRRVSNTQVQLFWRAFGASSLSSTAVLTYGSATWTVANIMNYTGGPASPNVHHHSFKMWHAALSEAEILAESLQGPPVRTSNIDSYVTLFDATDPGDDESGNARDWTASGTFATVPFQPVGTVGPVALAAAIQSPAALSIQPVTMGGAVALAAAALSPAITYPVTLGGPVAVAAVVQEPATASMQPVTLGGPVAVAAVVQEPAVGQILAPSVVEATAAPLQPAAASVQPVSMAAAVQLALTVQEPSVSTTGIQVSEPAPIILAAQRPAVHDPYPHGFARRTRGDFRRATLGG